MKKLIITFFLTCLFISSFATTYYIANNGNDTNNGTSTSTPWQTLDKVNATTLQPNDQVLFRRGDTFYGKLILPESSNSVNITFGAYGSGNKPIITGFTSVTAWTNKGGNIWESTNAVSTLSTLSIVAINGQSVPMGRYPNADVTYPYFPNYYNFQSHTGTGSGASSITSSSLTDGNNWSGADVVIRMNQWTFHKELITSQSGTTLSFNGVAGTLEDNWGFWIQNDIRTLDQQNEWYYNPSTKKLSIYSTTMPSNVQVSTVDTLFYFYSNIPTVTSYTLDNLQLIGANGNGVWTSGNLNFTVTNCDISYCGLEGIYLAGGGILSGTMNNNTFYANGSSAIATQGTVNNLTVKSNNINMSGVISSIKQNMYANGGIEFTSDNSLVQYNTIDSSAYCGINFNGANVQIRNNFINHSAIIRGDAAGIYTGYANNTGKVIDGNIVLNSQGNPRGARSNDYFAMGIYSDDLGNNFSITNNVIINARTSGIYLHNSNNLTVRNNIIYNCGALGTEIMWANGGISMDGNAGSPYANSVFNNTVTKNQIYSLNQYQYNLNYYDAAGSNNDPAHFGVIDSNYYVKVNSNATAFKSQIDDGATNINSLSGWNALYGKDANSTAYTITDANNLRAEYNETNIAKTISLGANYKDIFGNTYAGSLTLQPYSGAVLIYDSPITGSLVANAGADKTVYLTQGTSTTLDGSASSGTTYQWREISTDFSSGGTLTSPTSSTTTITGLTKQGTFYFELAATTSGTTKRDSMVLRVNYDVPPTGTLSNNFAMDNSRISDVINWRGDTTSFFPDSDMTHSQVGDSDTYTNSTNWWILYRDRVNAIGIDSLRGKLTTTIQDGYGNGSMINGTQVKYPRTEIVVDKPSSIDTSHIYMFEWKGYYPNQTNYMTGNNSITTIFQIHADSSYGENTMDLSLKADGTIAFTLFPNGPREQKFAIGTLADWTNNSHTLRLTIREGYGAPGNPAFMKLEVDGKQLVLRDTGRIGGTPGGTFGDFAKFGTLYDASNAMVDANATTHDRKFSLITESLKKYTLTSVPPLTNAGSNQIIILPSTSCTLNGTVTSVTAAIASYQWSKLSGGSATITNTNSLNTTITGLSKGTYVFNLNATDINGLQSNSTVQVIVQDNETINATGYNYDVLVDGVLNGNVSSLRTHDIDGSGFSFYVNGFSPNSTPLSSAYALPTDGVIISPTNTRYQFQPYNANNALWLDNNTSGTLTLTTPTIFDNKIKIALTSGGTSVQYKINYSDGSNDISTHSINNWACQGCTFYAINNLGRVDGTGALETTYWAIYEDSILPNPAKTVNSITFTSTGSWVSIFGLTDVPAPIMAPTIAISGDQSITVDNTNINAVATWAAGHTGTYSWSQISGPNSSTITTPNNFSTSVTGLTTGIYKYQCIITQDDGQTAAAVVTVTATIPVVINAGTDVIIYLTPIQPYNAN